MSKDLLLSSLQAKIDNWESKRMDSLDNNNMEEAMQAATVIGVLTALQIQIDGGMFDEITSVEIG